MIVGIDASNIRSGGGVTHLVEMLRAAQPAAAGFSQIIVWSSRRTLAQIEDRPWLLKSPQAALDRSLPYRTLWQIFALSRLALAASCSVLLVPGGSFAGRFRPVVTMSRNLLPFEWHELRRYGISWDALRLLLLRFTQSRSFRRVDGLIFLTRYAQQVVSRATGPFPPATAIIPHGIDSAFFCAPRAQLSVAEYSASRPFRLLYVSVIDVYKHQWHVIDAAGRLRAQGIPVSLTLVGPVQPRAATMFTRAIRRVDPRGEFVQHLGAVAHRQLPAHYAQADLCVFASSCENLPNILLEGMASGLPIACSRLGPMPEVLGDAGSYFNPEDPEDIARAVGALIASEELRARSAAASYALASRYSWTRCAAETMSLLGHVARLRLE